MMRSVAAFPSSFRILLALLCAALLAGCGLLPEQKDETTAWSANKLYSEAKEAQKEPYNLREKADILLLLIDAVHRSGATWDDLVDEAIDKMTENKDREWAKFDPEDPDKPLEHVR